jgi:hypothetical protein
MKPLSFTKCLENAFSFLPPRQGILYVSIGSFVRKTASPEKIHLQQAPTKLLTSGKKVVIVLVDPMFAQQDPVFLDKLSEYLVKENGSQVCDPTNPNVLWMKCGDFLEDGSHTVKKLVRDIQQTPYTEFYIGDFTMTFPCHPFQEYPEFHKKLMLQPNVWLSKSCTREEFVPTSPPPRQDQLRKQQEKF